MPNLARYSVCWVVAAAVALGLAGCGTAAGGAEAPRPERNYIAPAEVAGEAVTGGNAYLLVQRLRPLWLHKRGPKSIHFDPGILVYEGDMFFGDAESLQLIPTVEVHAMRFLPPDQATLLHGVGHPHGAIVVERKSGL